MLLSKNMFMLCILGFQEDDHYLNGEKGEFLIWIISSNKASFLSDSELKPFFSLLFLELHCFAFKR